MKLLRSSLAPNALSVLAVVGSAVAVRWLFFVNAPVFFEGDARGYLVRAVEIAGGDGLNFTLKRTPAYPIAMAGVFLFTGTSLDAIVLVQHVLGLLTALLAYVCGRLIAGPKAGLIAGLATGLSGSGLIYEQIILTETLFATGVMLMTVSLVLAHRHPPFGWLLLGGMVTAVSTLVRPVGLAMAAAVPPLAALAWGWRRGLVRCAIFAAGLVFVLAPWSVRNSMEHGQVAPVHPGRYLIERTMKYNPTGVSMYGDPPRPGEPAIERQARRILAEIEPERLGSYDVWNALSRRLRLSDAEISDLLWKLALDAILRHPDAYIRGTFIQLGQVIVGQVETVAEHTRIRRQSWKGQELEQEFRAGTISPDLVPESIPDLDARVQRAEVIAQLYQPGRVIGLILILGFAALWYGIFDPDRRLVFVPAAVAGALLACSVIIVGYEPRFRYPIDPLFHVCAAAGAVWLGDAIARRMAPLALGRRAGARA